MLQKYFFVYLSTIYYFIIGHIIFQLYFFKVFRNFSEVFLLFLIKGTKHIDINIRKFLKINSESFCKLF